jgi:hypothetical protein
VTELLPIPEVYLLSTLDVIEAGLAHYWASEHKPQHWEIVYSQLSAWCQERRAYICSTTEED